MNIVIQISTGTIFRQVEIGHSSRLTAAARPPTFSSPPTSPKYSKVNVHVRYMSSSVGLPSVCLSVTFVRPTQAIEIFGNISMPLVRWPSADIQVKFYGNRPRETHPSEKLNTRGVTEYSDFVPIERYNLGNGAI